MSVQTLLGTFEITDVRLKSVKDLEAVLEAVQIAGNEAVKGFLQPRERKWPFNTYFELDIDSKVGEFDE